MVVDLWTLKYQNWLSFEISCCQQYKINFNFDTFYESQRSKYVYPEYGMV